MKRKYIIITLIILLLGFFIIFFFKSKEVTFYFIVGNAQPENVNVGLVINQDSLFNDSLLNHRYEVKMIEKELGGGFLKMKLYSGNKLLNEENLFILFQKHIVIEYNDNCDGNTPCFKVNKRHQPFRLE